MTPTSQHECKNNHEGISGGMDGAVVLNIFSCSLHTQGICYTNYLGDGDSKAYQRVLAEKPFESNMSVTKL
jgi:NH3-dependent NAD+ synthetase